MKKQFPLFPPPIDCGGGPRAAAWGSRAAAGSRAGQGVWAASASGKSGLTPCPPPYVWPLWGLLRKRSGSKAGLGGAGGAEGSEPTTTAKLKGGCGSAWGAKCLVGVKPPVRCSSPVRRRIAVPPLDEPPREVGGLGLISKGSAKPEEEEEEEEDGEVCALGSSGGSGAISGGGSGGWGWGIEVRVKARGSTLGEMMRCFVLLHLCVRLPEPGMESDREDRRDMTHLSPSFPGGGRNNLFPNSSSVQSLCRNPNLPINSSLTLTHPHVSPHLHIVPGTPLYTRDAILIMATGGKQKYSSFLMLNRTEGASGWGQRAWRKGEKNR